MIIITVFTNIITDVLTKVSMSSLELNEHFTKLYLLPITDVLTKVSMSSLELNEHFTKVYLLFTLFINSWEPSVVISNVLYFSE